MVINPHDNLQASNVLSRMYTFYYEEWQLHLSQFLEEVGALDVSVKGPIFYSLNNVPADGVVKAEFFVPVEEDRPPVAEGIVFRSYFGIDSMISVWLHADFETRAEKAYARLIYYIETNGQKQVTPIFHVISGDREFPYMCIKIGVENKSNQEMWK